MESILTVACPPEQACWERVDAQIAPDFQQELALPAWDEIVLEHLREQAMSGCLLCSLERWNEEGHDDAETEE